MKHVSIKALGLCAAIWLAVPGAGTAAELQIPLAEAKSRFATAIELQESAPERAAAEMRALAEAGYARAMDRLAYFHLKGVGGPPDIDGAIALYRSAVAAGSGKSRVSLGKALMSAGLPHEAREVLQEAVDDGDRRAMSTLAWAHATGRLGALSRPAEGLATLRGLAAEDDRDAEMALLAGLIAQPRVPAQADAVLGRLHERHADGDARAAEALLRYYRMRGDPRGTLALRADLLETPGLRDKIRVEEGLHLAFKTQARRFWLASEEIVQSAPPDVYARALAVTARLNRNAYVRLVQKELRARGYRVGRPSPYLNAPLIRSINRFCRDRDITEACRPGPMKSATIKAVAAALARDRAAS